MTRRLKLVALFFVWGAATLAGAATLQLPKTFSLADFPLTYGVSAESSTFVGATVPQGNLLDTVVLEPVTGFFSPLLPNEVLRGVKFRVDALEQARLGFRFGAEASGGTLSSELAIRTDVSLPNVINPGDRVEFVLDPVLFAGPKTLTVQGPELTFFMDLVTEGAFRFETGLADGNGAIVSEPLTGLPLRAQFDASFNAPSTRVFEIGPGVEFTNGLFDGVDLNLRNPGSPDVPEGRASTGPIGGLLNPGGFRTTASAATEPIVGLDFDIDALVSRLVGLRTGVEGPGFSANAGLTGIDASLGSDPFKLTGKVDLINLGVEVGPALRNDYRLDITGTDLEIVDVVDPQGRPLNLDIDIGDPLVVGQIPLTFTAPANALPGETFTLEVDLSPNGSIQTQTGIVGGLAQTFQILAASLELAGAEIFKRALVDVDWPLRQTVPLNLATSTQSLRGAFVKQRLSIPFTIGRPIPEPIGLVVASCATWIVMATRRPQRNPRD